MKKVFADTVGLLALWDRSDQWHDAAETAFAALARDQAKLVTTSFVMLECANAAARRPYRGEVARLRDQLECRGLLIHPTLDEWQGAWRSYAREGSQGAGVVDHVSFLIMRRLEIDAAFTNDQHFRAAGFQLLF